VCVCFTYIDIDIDEHSLASSMLTDEGLGVSHQFTEGLFTGQEFDSDNGDENISGRHRLRFG